MFIIWYPYQYLPSYYFNKMIACYRKRKKGLPKYKAMENDFQIFKKIFDNANKRSERNRKLFS